MVISGWESEAAAKAGLRLLLRLMNSRAILDSRLDSKSESILSESMEASSMSDEGVDRLRDGSGNVTAMELDVMGSTDIDVDGRRDAFA